MTPVEEVTRGFDDLVSQGKVLYIGVSDAPSWWVAKANTLADLRGWTQFVGLQIEYSLIERTVERELIPMAKACNIGVVAWSPLAGGVLSGKYHSAKASDARYSTEMMKDFMSSGERTDRIIQALNRVSKKPVARTPRLPWPGCAIARFRWSPSSVRGDSLSYTIIWTA